MKIKDIIYEDFVNYKVPSMFIGTCFCTFKCCIEANISVEICQNHELIDEPFYEICDEKIYDAYVSNPITKAIVIGGLEPMLQFDDILDFIDYFRNNCNDDIVIYTGYYPNEIEDKLEKLRNYNNIIIKFGRYIPNRPSRYDDILGINLVSDNQYAERIS